MKNPLSRLRSWKWPLVWRKTHNHLRDELTVERKARASMVSRMVSSHTQEMEDANKRVDSLLERSVGRRYTVDPGMNGHKLAVMIDLSHEMIDLFDAHGRAYLAERVGKMIEREIARTSFLERINEPRQPYFVYPDLGDPFKQKKGRK